MPATLIVVDGSNERLHLLRATDGAALRGFGSRGSGPGQFHWVHAIAVDSKGRVYTGEITGHRVQRWLPAAP